MPELLGTGKRDLEKRIEELGIELKKKGEELEDSGRRFDELSTHHKKVVSEKEKLEERIVKESLAPVLKTQSIRSSFEYLLELLEASKRKAYEPMRGAEADVIIFTHDDGDGLCCGANLDNLYKKSDRMIFHIGQDKSKIIASAKPRKQLITADLVITEEIAKYAKGLRESGIEVRLIDHHKGSMNLPGELLSYLRDNNMLVWDSVRSAASLVCRHYGLNDELSQKIALIADRCEGEISERTICVDDDAKTLSKLARLHMSTLDGTRCDIARHGTITSKALKRRSEVVNLLVAYSSDIMSKMLIKDSGNFQVYEVPPSPPIIGTKVMLVNFRNKTGKDTFFVRERVDNVDIRGRSRYIRPSDIYPLMAERFSGTSNTIGNSGGCKFPTTNGKTDDVIGFLQELYDHQSVIYSARACISNSSMMQY